mgnify:CR=1 FL=1
MRGGWVAGGLRRAMRRDVHKTRASDTASNESSTGRLQASLQCRAVTRPAASPAHRFPAHCLPAHRLPSNHTPQPKPHTARHSLGIHGHVSRVLEQLDEHAAIQARRRDHVASLRQLGLLDLRAGSGRRGCTRGVQRVYRGEEVGHCGVVRVARVLALWGYLGR